MDRRTLMSVACGGRGNLNAEHRLAVLMEPNTKVGPDKLQRSPNQALLGPYLGGGGCMAIGLYEVSAD